MDWIWRETAKKVSHHFRQSAGRRGWNAKMTVNSRDQAVDIDVCVQSRQQLGKGVVRDLKILSGGERSFTTVALIMALGQEIRAPFMLLDEFDVYMDPENRQRSLQALLGFGAEHRACQFIFVSPQDVTAVDHALEQYNKNEGVAKGVIPADLIHVQMVRPPREH